MAPDSTWDHSPLRATDHDQPEMALALVRERPARKRPIPSGADVVLGMEVSVTTVREDREKAAVYSRAGVPEYWLVNPDDGKVEVHRGPNSDSSHRSKQTFGRGEAIPWPERADRVDAAELVS